MRTAMLILTILSSLLLAGVPARAAIVLVEPDNFAAGTILNTALSSVTLSVEGKPGVNVISIDGFSVFNSRNLATTGTLVFGRSPNSGGLDVGQRWDEITFGILRADFDSPTRRVQIDLLFDDDDDGFLRAFDASGSLLAEVIGAGDGLGRGDAPEIFVASILRATADIAFILAGGLSAEGLFLDNLQFDIVDVSAAAVIPLPAALPLYGTGLAVMGFLGWRRKRAALIPEPL